MKEVSFQVKLRDGRLKKGLLHVMQEDEFWQYAHLQNWTVISASLTRKRFVFFSQVILFLKNKIGHSSQSSAAWQVGFQLLHQLFRSQLTEFEVVSLARGFLQGPFAAILRGVYVQMEEGKGFIQSLEKYKKKLPFYLFPLISMGASNQNMAHAFAECSRLSEEVASFRQKFSGACRYPACLFLFLFIMLFLYQNFFLPQVISLEKEIGISHQVFFLDQSILLVLMIVFGGVLCILLRAYFYRMKYLLCLMYLSSLTRHLSVEDALDLVSEFYQGKKIGKKLESWSFLIKAGEPLDQSFVKSNFSDDLTAKLLSSACETSRISEAFALSFSIHHADFNHKTKRFLSMLQPFFLLLVALLLILMISQIYTPLYTQMINHIAE